MFEIADETVEREPILQQPLQRFSKLTCGDMHPPSGIIAVANEGSIVAFTLALPAKAQLPIMFARRASSCVAMCFTSVSGRLAVAFQDGFIFVYKVLRSIGGYRVAKALLTIMSGRSRQQQPAPSRVLRVCARCAACSAVQGALQKLATATLSCLLEQNRNPKTLTSC